MNDKASFSLPFRLQRGTDRVKKASCEIKVVLLAAPQQQDISGEQPLPGETVVSCYLTRNHRGSHVTEISTQSPIRKSTQISGLLKESSTFPSELGQTLQDTLSSFSM